MDCYDPYLAGCSVFGEASVCANACSRADGPMVRHGCCSSKSGRIDEGAVIAFDAVWAMYIVVQVVDSFDGWDDFPVVLHDFLWCSRTAWMEEQVVLRSAGDDGESVDRK